MRSNYVKPHREAKKERKKKTDGRHFSNTNSNVYYDNISREKERKSQSTVQEEAYRYKRFVKLTLVKLDFSHLGYRSMQSQEKTNKQTAGR